MGDLEGLIHPLFFQIEWRPPMAEFDRILQLQDGFPVVGERLFPADILIVHACMIMEIASAGGGRSRPSLEGAAVTMGLASADPYRCG